ncbi:hypothetical protein [Bacillus massiliigorillae]|uniref:hypothetical protein n=1 Tax=Bacillus massiliigorillae TaxID=1243664 RepID=UPI0003A6DCC1|nr:hypothetical protein [Bacillus massiliigorillae]
MSKQATKTLGYVRVVMVEKGNVVHICPNTLHHPDPQEQERLQNVITVDLLNEILPETNFVDSQVLVLFHNDGETTTVEHTILIQQGFKEFWQNRISKKIDADYSSLRDEIHVQERIDLWESTYKEPFSPIKIAQ